MGAFVDFSKAAFAALNGSPELTAFIGAGRVFDDVPHASEAAAKDYPYVVIGEQQGVEAGTSSTSAADMTITIDVWSRGAGKQQCLAMLDIIREALDAGPENNTHVVANGVLVYLNYLGHETLPPTDGETRHGIIRFRGYYQYG